MSATAGSTASSGNTLEQLTNDHRVVVSSRAELSRPRARRQSADRNRLPERCSSRRATSSCWTTDGVYEHVSDRFMAEAISDGAAISTAPRADIVERPTSNGSTDNLTVQIVSDRRAAATARPAKLFATAVANCRCRRCWRRARCSTAIASCANCTAQQPQPHLSRRRHDTDDAGRAENSVDRSARRSRPICSAS